MCRLYGFYANQPTRVECTLVHAQNALMVQSHTDWMGKSHGHGWGIAAYSDTFPIVEREAWPAFQNRHFRDAAARVYSSTVIAHVRRATVGEFSLANTHPFVHEVWSFAHNGTIPNFHLVGPRLLEAMVPEHRDAVAGETDSEHFFRFVMSLVDSGWPPYAAVTEAARTVVRWCRDLDPNEPIGLNVLLTDGKQLIGVRWGRSLVYVERAGLRDCEICRYPHVRSAEPAAGYRAAVVASEPLTHGEEWAPVPEGSVFRVLDGFQLETTSLGLPNPPESPAMPPRVVGRVRTTLVDEFMIDHRAMADGFRNLRDALMQGDAAASARLADHLDRAAGAHIAFEESDLYPALEAGPDMYDDHGAGLAALQHVVAAGGSLPPADTEAVIGRLDQMIEHMEDCGRLLDMVEHLSPDRQSELEEKLHRWRAVAPRWSHSAARDGGTGEGG